MDVASQNYDEPCQCYQVQDSSQSVPRKNQQSNTGSSQVYAPKIDVQQCRKSEFVVTKWIYFE